MSDTAIRNVDTGRPRRASKRCSCRWSSAKNSERRGFWGAISGERDHVFFVEGRSDPFLRDSPLKFREGFVVAHK